MQEPLEMSGKLRKRFYEAIVFEKSLIKACPSGPERSANSNTDDLGLNQSAKKAFHAFLSRLAQVCDNKRGGDAVTAVAVLQDFDCVHYFLGSNQREELEATEVEHFATCLLEVIGKATHGQPKPAKELFSTLLRLVLNFNVPRIKFYVENLANWLGECINLDRTRNGQGSNTTGGARFGAFLSDLQHLVGFHGDLGLTDQEYLSSCEKVILFIHKHASQQDVADSMFEQAREGQMDTAHHWQELRHFVGRLQSYYVAVDTIVRAHRRWPELFQGFKVTIVPSSKPQSKPITKTTTTAKEIIGRMTAMSRNPDEAARRQREVEFLQRFDLNDIIEDECKFKPIVHAEVLVHHYVEGYLKSQEESGVRYWNGWKLIGTSKPTCRLCWYYFYCLLGSGVPVRETHGNLYPRWRFPDVFDAVEAKKRDDLANKMVSKIREDAFETMSRRLPQGAIHDSSTFPAVPGYFVTGNTDATSVNGIASQLGTLAIGANAESRGGITVASPARDDDRWSVAAEAASETTMTDDEDGAGRLIFTGRRGRSVAAM